MASLLRLFGWFSIFGGGFMFLILQGTLNQISQIASAVVLLAILATLMFSGKSRAPLPKKSKIPETSIEEVIVEQEIPPPVVELEGASERRQEKIERSRGKIAQPAIPAPPAMPAPPGMPAPTQQAPPPLPPSPAVAPPMPPLPDPVGAQAAEGTKLAEKFVISSDAQSEMEAEVESFVEERRQKRAAIRASIERKRRMAMAHRRAAKARMWADVEDGEDLATLLDDPNHGLTVLEGSQEVDDSKPIGITYVRIDEERILKLRVPLEVEKKSQKTEESSVDIQPFPPLDSAESPPPGPPPLPPPPGLPPMPPPPGLPPMPPPPGPPSE